MSHHDNDQDVHFKVWKLVFINPKDKAPYLQNQDNLNYVRSYLAGERGTPQSAVAFAARRAIATINTECSSL